MEIGAWVGTQTVLPPTVRGGAAGTLTVSLRMENEVGVGTQTELKAIEEWAGILTEPRMIVGRAGTPTADLPSQARPSGSFLRRACFRSSPQVRG